jgi:hypothetical protein
MRNGNSYHRKWTKVNAVGGLFRTSGNRAKGALTCIFPAIFFLDTKPEIQ